MRYRINYSPEFLNDLFEIGDYIESQYQNPQAADRITDGIVDATDILAEYPETGARIFLPGGLDSGYRFVIFQGYLAVYRIQPGEVFVVRAVHEKQDYMRILFPRSPRAE
ncbi:MAG: type II toxin-antitoxin system RelE/ParE family toxin [Clostridia bacterium]|nr:type II toxin-antitoxin system RelE/ParE family toxin [Clostridia bacterium]MBQ6324491.1 type II toxin-antitoxin system RelE/ParE family toxin [Clostridia bacterium]MBQ9039492.1 type II toxin-antitoxin system RelE/ParE family toxin [Clostridia bacterium]